MFHHLASFSRVGRGSRPAPASASCTCKWLVKPAPCSSVVHRPPRLGLGPAADRPSCASQCLGHGDSSSSSSSPTLAARLCTDATLGTRAVSANNGSSSTIFLQPADAALLMPRSRAESGVHFPDTTPRLLGASAFCNIVFITPKGELYPPGTICVKWPACLLKRKRIPFRSNNAGS